MKILFIKLMRGFYGGEKQTKETIEALRTRGHEIYLLALPGSQLAKRTRCPKFYFDIKPYPDTRVKTLLFSAKLPFYQNKARRFITKLQTAHNFDVACLQEPYEKIVFSPALAQNKIKITWLEVLYWEPFLVANKLLFSLLLHSQKYCDGVIASSYFLQKQISNYINRKKIVLIKHALRQEDIDRLAKLKPRQNLPIKKIGFAGSLSKLKGIYVLLDAFYSIHQQNLRLKLYYAGSGHEADNLALKIRQMGLERSVFLLGKQNIRQFFARIDLLIAPSLYDNLPYVLQEAIVAKIPVITTLQGGMPEYFQSKEVREFCLAKPGSPKSLKDKIAQMINSPDFKIKQITKLNRDYYLKHFQFKRYILEIEGFFKQLSKNSND